MGNDKKIKVKTEINNLTDKDFYQQACEYFYYHAEQRTTMINYFIAVYGAGIALFGSVVNKDLLTAMLISGFMFLISLLFCSIDLRNKFDVKHSQSVIAQIERDYGMNLLGDDAEYVYGVFSNEDNTFRYYGREHRKEKCNKEYRKLRRKYKWIGFLERIKVKEKYIKKLDNELNYKVECYLKNDKTISNKEFKNSMNERSIRSLSKSIKLMYYLCMGLSLVGFFGTAWKAGYIQWFINLMK